jgi:hypothetical protein
MTKLTNTYASQYRSLVREAQVRPLIFRRHARHALRNFSRKERRLSLKLNGDVTDSLYFYTQWEKQLVPQLETLQQASKAKTLRKELSQRLLFEDQEIDGVLASLIAQRSSELTQQLLDDAYKRSERKALKAARRFMARPLDENIDFIKRDIQYRLYKQVAREERITLYDTHTFLFRRLVQLLRETRQVRRLTRRTKRQQRKNNRIISTLEQQNDGLIASLFALRIDLISIRSAYQSYEKALKKLPESGRKSPSKQLALYEKETASLREAHLESIAGIHGLQDIQRAATEIDAILLRIFDLNNREYNQLMAQLKQYRDLQREQKHLIALLEK